MHIYMCRQLSRQQLAVTGSDHRTVRGSLTVHQHQAAWRGRGSSSDPRSQTQRCYRPNHTIPAAILTSKFEALATSANLMTLSAATSPPPLSKVHWGPLEETSYTQTRQAIHSD